MTDLYSKYFPDYDWYDSTFDDAKTIGALMGFDIDDIYFSGFSSQGDGACFTGRLHYRKGAVAAVKAYAPLDLKLHAIAAAWQEANANEFYRISGTVKHSGRYSHENCTSFDFEDSRRCYGWTQTGFDESSFIEPARDFMRWIYRQLETESEYQYASALAFGWQERGEEMRAARAAARQLVSDMRAARKAERRLRGRAWIARLFGLPAAPTAESICQALRRSLRSLANDWESARKERDEIAGAFWFRDSDGKRWNVPEFAAEYV